MSPTITPISSSSIALHNPVPFTGRGFATYQDYLTWIFSPDLLAIGTISVRQSFSLTYVWQ